MHLLLGALAWIWVHLPAARADAIDRQYDRALRGALANLQTSGAIVASPSRSEPNYFFDWMRDSSLTMKALIEVASDPSTDEKLRSILLPRIERWIDWERSLQEHPELTGLGEPRYNLDGTTNTDPWGRPQNDGPALRAIAAIRVAELWLRSGRIQEVQKKLYEAALPARTLIKRDLEYVAHHWREESVDLWEEERGMHFYTLTAQKTALEKGAEFAIRMNDPAAASFYRGQSIEIARTLEQFLDSGRGIVKYAISKNPGLPHKTSDLDIAVVLIAIQTFDGRFQVPAGPVLHTLNALMDSFRSLYAVNSLRADEAGRPLGVAIGRYPQDVYDGAGFGGGNPWFLSTLAAAEFYCDLARISNGPSKKSFLDFAEAQFKRVMRHLDANGSMSEQFSRENGYERGARDLTWSYVSYITAYRSCRGQAKRIVRF